MISTASRREGVGMLRDATALQLARQVLRLEGDLARARQQAALAEAARQRAERAAREAWQFAKTMAHAPAGASQRPT